MDDGERFRQLTENRQRIQYDQAMRYDMAESTLTGYGEWVASLAPWRWFVTLTHRPPDRWEEGWNRHGERVILDTGATIVGPKPHRRAVREWFYDDVRRLDPGARWWSEAERHKSGSMHEHGLLAVDPSAPHLLMRTAWFERAGFALMKPVTHLQGAAVYVAKYTGKAAALEPCVYGMAASRVQPGSFADRVLGVELVSEVERAARRRAAGK